MTFLNKNLVEVTDQQQDAIMHTAQEIALEIFASADGFDKDFIANELLPTAYRSSPHFNINRGIKEIAIADALTKELDDKNFNGKDVLGVAVAVLKSAEMIEMGMLPAGQTKDDHIAWLTQSVEREKTKQANNRFQASKTLYKTAYKEIRATEDIYNNPAQYTVK